MNKKILIILFFLVPTYELLGETHYILFDGGDDRASNYYRYYNQLRHSYEILKSKGKSVKIFAKDGSWKLHQARTNEKKWDYALTKKGKAHNPSNEEIPSYPPIDGKIETKRDFKKALNSTDYQKGDKLVIYFASHGGAPVHALKPGTATYSLFGGEITYQEMIDILPRNITVKMITSSCYGGGIHHISRKRNNVCSLASTSHLYLSTSSDATKKHIAPYGREIFETIKNKKNLTLSKLGSTALKNDYGNIGLGSLSSFDYIDYVLRKGPYDPYAPKEIINGVIDNHSFLQIKSEYKRSAMPDEKTLFSIELDKQNQKLHDHSSSIICRDQFEHFSNLKKFEKILQNLLNHNKTEETIFTSTLLMMSQTLSDFFQLLIIPMTQI